MKLTSNEIQQILPHRYPFLLVDRIDNCEPGKSAEGIKAVSANEMQFVGHFPDNHVMPGVLMVESAAQVGAIAILTKEEYKDKFVLFAGIKKIKFKRVVRPGDLLNIKVEVIKIKGPIGIGKVEITVDGEKAVVGELSFAITDK